MTAGSKSEMTFDMYFFKNSICLDQREYWSLQHKNFELTTTNWFHAGLSAIFYVYYFNFFMDKNYR